MNLRVSALRSLAINAESCGFSREMLKGKSSESTTPLTNRIHSGKISGDLASINTLREYNDTPGSIRPMPNFSE